MSCYRIRAFTFILFCGALNAKAETPVLWPLHANSWLTGKDPDAGRDWGQEEKGVTEDEMAGWHHRLDGHEFEWTPRVGDGQGGLACCNSWGRKESDTTERLNWTELSKYKSDGSGCHRGQSIVKARGSGKQLQIVYYYIQNSRGGVSETGKQQAVG